MTFRRFRHISSFVIIVCVLMLAIRFGDRSIYRSFTSIPRRTSGNVQDILIANEGSFHVYARFAIHTTHSRIGKKFGSLLCVTSTSHKGTDPLFP
jgi:hypothetical protein